MLLVCGVLKPHTDLQANTIHQVSTNIETILSSLNKKILSIERPNYGILKESDANKPIQIIRSSNETELYFYVGGNGYYIYNPIIFQIAIPIVDV